MSDQPSILGGTPLRPEGPPEWPLQNKDVESALREVIENRAWGKYHAGYCEELVKQLQDYHDCEQAVLCSSGTAAIELALRGLNVGPGDEVLLAAYDFKGNFGDVIAVGATPVLVDVQVRTPAIDVSQVETGISKSTKAIVVSHLHGTCVDMKAVTALAAEREIPVIEDACQMPGAIVQGKRAGTWGDVGVLSFGGSKLLSAGRGGALISNRTDVLQRARLYSHRGNEAYPLSEVQAAILLPQLKQLDAMNARRAENVAALADRIAHLSGLTMFRTDLQETQASYYKLGFWYDAQLFGGLSRDLFCQAMRAEGIAMDAGFRALDKIHSSRRFQRVGRLNNATLADKSIVILHHPALLGTADDVEQIAAALDRIHAHDTMIRVAYMPG